MQDMQLVDEMSALRTIADSNPTYEGLFIDYLVATKNGDEEVARSAKAFMLYYQATDIKI
jgi:hypothetical protein